MNAITDRVKQESTAKDSAKANKWPRHFSAPSTMGGELSINPAALYQHSRWYKNIWQTRTALQSVQNRTAEIKIGQFNPKQYPHTIR
ncbi:MAG: hypothetical protein WAN35_13785 [Terracidiphilus sp.]